MKVKIKIINITFLSILCMFFVTYSIFNLGVNKYIREIEIENAKEAFSTINTVIDKEKQGMGRTAKDWGHWDSTYEFMADKNEQYIEENVNQEALGQLDLNFMYFIDSNGKLFHGISKDVQEEEQLIDDILSGGNTSNKILQFNDLKSQNSGLIYSSGRLTILTAVQITDSSEGRESVGTLIVGRYLDNSLGTYLNKVVKSQVNFEEVAQSEEFVVGGTMIEGKQYITAEDYIQDIRGNKTIGVKLHMESFANTQGQLYIKMYLLIFIGAIFIMLTVYLKLVGRFVLKPLDRVWEFAKKVAETRDTKARLEINGNDELNSIAVSINEMLSALGDAYDSLERLSNEDKLTGLNNRKYIEELLDRLDHDKNINYFIIMGDFNGLKVVNDAFGHFQGDKLIKSVGEIFEQVCEEDDEVARWGGDEFLILVIEKDEEYVKKLILQIKASCEEIKKFHITVSIALGYAKRDKDCTESEMVMALAENRMYRNKLIEDRSVRSATINSLLKTLHEKRSETEEHTMRIKQLSSKLGKRIGLAQERIDELELFSLLHDIGKIGIPDSILLKPEKLTDEECEVMKTHSEIGYRITKANPELAHISEYILAHHEKFDGTGYPKKLKREEIPILARILNIVDSYDVIMYKKIYKDAQDEEYAIEELKRCSGTHFDPFLVEEFLDMLDEMKKVGKTLGIN